MGQRSLVIIDDDRMTRDSVQGLFISRGWEVAMAASQADGLSLLIDYEPDWVAIAWDQLQGNGATFFRRVRAGNPRSQIMLFTANLDRAGRVLIKRLGPDAHLSKPFGPEDVFRICEPRERALAAASPMT
jgi:DNA-binding response OmpR family regulator